MIGTGITRHRARSPDEGSLSITPIAHRALLRALFSPAAGHRARLIQPATVLPVHRPIPHRRLLAILGTGARFKSP